MKKFLENAMVVISILILVWFATSLAEIAFTEKGPDITPEYSKANIIVSIFKGDK